MPARRRLTWTPSRLRVVPAAFAPVVARLRAVLAREVAEAGLAWRWWGSLPHRPPCGALGASLWGAERLWCVRTAGHPLPHKDAHGTTWRPITRPARVRVW